MTPTQNEQFLCEQLSSLRSDLDRYQRMLDGLRRAFMEEHGCCDAEAELRLMQDSPLWNRIRRQEAATRQGWLRFNRTLTAERKLQSNAAVASPPEPDIIEDDDPPCPDSPAPSLSYSSPPAPQPRPNPIL